MASMGKNSPGAEKPTALRWRRPVLAVALVTVLAMGAWALVQWHYGRRAVEPVPDRPAAPDNPEVPFSIARAQPTLEVSPLPGIVGSPKLEKSVFEVGADGTCTFALPGIRRDQPMVELRFYRRKSDKELAPLWINRFTVQRWINGKPAGKEITDFPGATPRKAKALRSPAAREDAGGTDLWRFGRQYYVLFWPLDEARNSSKVSFEAVVEIPQSIPRGKVAVISVIADHRWPKLTKALTMPRTIEGRVAWAGPGSVEDLEVSYWGSESYDHHRVRPKSDGSFRVKADRLGGVLRVTRRVRSGCGWAYIKPVKKRSISVPKDADLLVEAGNLVDFKLVVPKTAVASSMVGIALKVAPDDPVPMCWARVADSARAAKGGVSMSFVPGTYWVEALYHVEGPTGTQRKTVELGQVKIARDSAGKRVRVVKSAKASSSAGGRASLDAKKLPETFTSISGRITGALPKKGASYKAIYFPPDKKGECGYVRRDQRFFVKASAPGGWLLVKEADEEVRRVWFLIRSVNKGRMQLPQDADVVVDPEELVSFKVAIAAECVKNDLYSISIRAAASDPLGMVWTPPFDASARRAIVESGTVALQCVPGKGYVVGTYISGKGKDRKVSTKHFGSITVARDSEEKVLVPVLAR